MFAIQKKFKKWKRHLLSGIKYSQNIFVKQRTCRIYSVLKTQNNKKNNSNLVKYLNRSIRKEGIQMANKLKDVPYH